MTPPVFAHGHLRLYLLALLNEQPRHGYELIQALSDRFDGTYAPSAGTIYPRLAKLEDEGLVTKQADGRKTIYRITDAGRAEVAARADELDEIEKGVDSSVRRLAQELREDLSAARDRLRTEFSDLRDRSGAGDVPTWGSDFGEKASEFAQRAARAANAGWSAAEVRRAAGDAFGSSATAGFQAARDTFVGEAADEHGAPDAQGDVRAHVPSGAPDDATAPGGAGAPGSSGGAPSDPNADSFIARRADVSLNRFRQDLRQDLRRAEAEGRVSEDIVKLLDTELTRVRDLLRHALAPRD